MKKNENYSIQLITIINEQKMQMQNIKNKNIEKNNDEIIILKRQIEKLKNDIELKQNIIETMKKGHKNLQSKYLNICYNFRKKEQEDLFRQAQILQKQKLEKEYISSRLISNPISKSSSLSAFHIKKNSNIKNRNKKNNKLNSFPTLNINYKIGEGSKINNDEEIHEGDKLDKINDMMRQIIEEKK